jgi:two-component system response regulator HydG
MTVTPRVLVVDDDDGVRYTISSVLEESGLAVEAAASGEEALERLAHAAEPFHLIITDLRMPGIDGLELLRRLRDPSAPQPPRVIVITAHGSERAAVEAMKLGAYDYFRKPFEVDDLLAVVQRAVESVRLSAENERLASELNLSRSLVFASSAMSRLALLIGRVAPRDVTVLISGESGTGKERVAEAIVRASPRSRAPFVRFNCAALSPELAEAELFGHSRGAFTGAHRARNGLFREAHTGTMLLDEVGELDGRTQANLLRVLQEGEVRPVGEDRPVAVDVRILAATNRDLEAMVRAGTFREDLYYRLKVVQLHIPRLRERPEDIPVLARHFLARYADRFATGPIAVPAGLDDRLLAHDWPGNVRELENAVESLVALSVDGELDLSLLPGAAGPVGVGGEGGRTATLKDRIDAHERGLIATALQQVKGNRTEAAKVLGISRATLHEKLRKHRFES